MAYLELSDGSQVLVDDADLPLVASYWWAPHPSGSSLMYARAWVGPRRRMMHSLLTGWAQVDHANGNGLDNRRSNLRPASRSLNMANRKKGQGGSRFKGVYIYKPNRWKAQIGYGGKRVYLGLFDSEEEAARAYDDRAREVFGSYAALNFPRAGENSCHR